MLGNLLNAVFSLFQRFLRLKWDSEEIEIMKKKMMELVVEDFNSDIGKIRH